MNGSLDVRERCRREKSPDIASGLSQPIGSRLPGTVFEPREIEQLIDDV